MEQIIIRLDQPSHHLVHLGLREKPIALDLQVLRAQIQFSKELSVSLRDVHAKTLEAAQVDFKLPSHWNRVRN